MRAVEILGETINPDILDPRFEHTQEIGEFTLKAKSRLGDLGMSQLNISCFQHGSLVGTADFWVYDSCLKSGLTWVAKDVRNKGVASMMYAYARMLGNDIKPSENQLPPGRAMWDAWRKSGEVQHLAENAESQITLKELYHGDLPDRTEIFWEYVRPGDIDIPLTIETMPRHMVMVMMLSQYRAEHIDEVVELLEPEQLEIVERYQNDPSLSDKIIVMDDYRLIDGNHRALAAALNNSSIKYIDLAELNKEAQ